MNAPLNFFAAIKKQPVNIIDNTSDAIEYRPLQN